MKFPFNQCEKRDIERPTTILCETTLCGVLLTRVVLRGTFAVVFNIAEDNADRRKAIVLSEVGTDFHQILSDLRSPEKPPSKTLKQLLKKLKDLFEPVPKEMAEFGRGYRNIMTASPTTI